MNIAEILKGHSNIFAQPLPFHFRLPNNISAKEALVWTFRQHLSAREEGRELVWLSEYDEVADSLTDNHGRGLLLFGRCGQGKTLLARHVLPFIYELVFKGCSATSRLPTSSRTWTLSSPATSATLTTSALSR